MLPRLVPNPECIKIASLGLFRARQSRSISEFFWGWEHVRPFRFIDTALLQHKRLPEQIQMGKMPGWIEVSQLPAPS